MTHDPAAQDELLEHVGIDRRRFVKRLVVGSAFAAPVVSSFSMSGVNAVFAQDTNVSGGPEVSPSSTEATTTTTEGDVPNQTDGDTPNQTDGDTPNQPTN